MRELIKYPSSDQWASLCLRPAMDTASLRSQVEEIIDEVKQNGDDALKSFAKKFDSTSIEKLLVSEEEIEMASKSIDKALDSAMQIAIKNIHTFHKAQLEMPVRISTKQGVECWRKSVPIERVGLYIPGGSAPLFSTLLMLAIPAKIAGCIEIILCTPPDKSGMVHPAILHAARLTGITKIFKAGGAQAVAAMAFGTESIPKVHKIFGPGNQYVTCAKQLVQQNGVAIDMPAGPSEVLVLADETCHPAFVAADLLSQAEHGSDSQVILLSTDEHVLIQCQNEIKNQLADLPRNQIAEQALSKSHFILMKSIDDCLDFVNQYAPEHLIIACKNDEQLAEKIINAGSVFLGNYSPESAGDYASGTNHTLPTGGYAKAYSGVSLDSFVKKITFQKLTKEGLQKLASTIETGLQLLKQWLKQKASSLIKTLFLSD